MPQYNAKRVMHKFIGTQQVFTDGIGEWRDLTWTSSLGEQIVTKFIAIGGFLIFQGNLTGKKYMNEKDTWSADIPVEFKNLTIFTPPFAYDLIVTSTHRTTFAYDATLSGNKIILTQQNSGYSKAITGTVILNYKI